MELNARGPARRRFMIRAGMDRRRAEAVALALRRRLAQLGIDGARVSVTSSSNDAGKLPRQTQGQGVAPSA